MMNLQGKLVMLTLLAAFVTGASATMQQSDGPITNLRIEGSYGFIGLTNAMPTCGSRVWVDMTTPLGRAVYATALAAFNAKQSVTIRAGDDSARVFGVCNLYDIYVAQ